MSSVTSTSLSPSSSSGGSITSSGGSQHGSNYFFGFLITFVGLLMIFIAFGIGSRRRFAARRDGILNGAWGPTRRFPYGKLDETPPRLYERPLAMGESKWQSLMPLSVRLCKGEEEEEEIYSPAPGLQPLPPAILARRGRDFPSLPPTQHKDPSLPTQSDPEQPEETTLQVAVMIAMPSKSLIHKASGGPKRADSDRLPEYQIGSVTFPWGQQGSHPDS